MCFANVQLAQFYGENIGVYNNKGPRYHCHISFSKRRLGNWATALVLIEIPQVALLSDS